MKKIPDLPMVNDVSGVNVSENREKLVLLNDVNPDKLVVFSKAYKEGKKGAIERSFVRETVKEKVISAADNLPKGYKLVVWETYTPKSLIEGIRNEKLQDISGFAHMTGGSVDVSLADSHGNVLDMGTDLSHSAPQNKSTLHYEQLKDGELSDEAKELRENRRILFHAMSDAGFTNNPLAWFHWDYGNLWWGKATGRNGFYSSLDM
ncbi:M15 family metallopeptidase [Guptibacillus spartinae]|uniref:M15 family metallopeptidase n=1 Tax=Guptibacillus spartinae TaxID=3025679 RepID=UPI00235F396D|nr:M15 family metallopeptidase [Pseudalkalibacillus spartinae]